MGDSSKADEKKEKQEKKLQLKCRRWEGNRFVPAPCGGPSQAKGEFIELVYEALSETTTFSKISDIETYISSNYRSTLDAFGRKKLITKIVVENILNGCLLFRTIKGNCI